MKTPGLSCPVCGSKNLRRSKRQSIAEISHMLLGAYPFRCLQCGVRSWQSVWMLSQLLIAKCPKCLRAELVTCPEKFFRPTLLRRLQFTLGGHRYRCDACRYNFVSFRSRLSSPANRGTARPAPDSAHSERFDPSPAPTPPFPEI